MNSTVEAVKFPFAERVPRLHTTNTTLFCNIAAITKRSKNRFKTYLNGASKRLINIKKRSEKVSEKLDSFTDSIEQVKTIIVRRGEDIKRMVDTQTDDLLEELNSRKTFISKKMETIQENLQRDLLICDSFKQFCEKIVAEADYFETLSVSDELATRAAELKVMSIPEVEIFPQFEFIPSDFDITGNQKNIVGKLVGEFKLKQISSKMVVIEEFVRVK